MMPIHYVGLAYGAIAAAVFFFVLRLAKASTDLSERVAKLEQNSTN
jgi:hypothetical protein